MLYVRARAATPRPRHLVGALLLIAALMLHTPTALAHAELRESSPAADQTVGGSFHQIAMHFTGLDPAAIHEAKLFDPAGNLVTDKSASEGQRFVIPIEPLTVPGEYMVTYAVHGIDGDFTEESFGFRFDPAADEPAGITIGVIEPEGFDFVLLTLLLVAAGLAAFLVARVMSAWREHRAAQSVLAGPNE